MPKKKQKGTNPVFVLNSTMRIHAIMGFGEACHELHRPMLPTPQLSTKRELQSNTDGPWPDSQQKPWRVWPVRKQTTLLPTYPTLPFHPNPDPKEEKQTEQQQQTQATNCKRAVPWRRGRQQRLLGYALHLIPEHWLQSWRRYSHAKPGSPSSRLVLRSLTRSQQSTLTYSFT